MEQYDVIRLALVLAIQAEIEGMKAANDRQKVYNAEPIYHEGYFQEKAEELRNTAAMHNGQM